MADSADVRSIDALREWYATLIAYGENLAEALAGVEMEIRRGADWLHDQLGLWQRAVRECEEEVVQAKAELAARKFPDWSGRNPDTTVQEKVLRQAKARLEHAEEQVQKVRSWIARLPKAVDETYSGPARRLGNFLEVELPKGLAVLDRRIAALESYAGLRPDYAPGPTLSSVQAAPPPRTPGADAPGSPEKPTDQRPPDPESPR
jgi:hypothetical protein